MIKFSKNFILILLPLLIFIIFIVYKNIHTEDVFDTEQFAKEMKSRNYEFKINDASKDVFLKTKRKIMKIGEENIYIYVYNSNKKMEKDAQNIDSGGCSYSSEGLFPRAIYISWAGIPHFFKKGRIIVLYLGGNDKIKSDLKDILGEQFAGFE